MVAISIRAFAFKVWVNNERPIRFGNELKCVNSKYLNVHKCSSQRHELMMYRWLDIIQNNNIDRSNGNNNSSEFFLTYIRTFNTRKPVSFIQFFCCFFQQQTHKSLKTKWTLPCLRLKWFDFPPQLRLIGYVKMVPIYIELCEMFAIENECQVLFQLIQQQFLLLPMDTRGVCEQNVCAYVASRTDWCNQQVLN